MASSSSTNMASSLLMIASGPSVVTWDCHQETSPTYFAPFTSSLSSSSAGSGDQTRLTNTNPIHDPPMIADLAWNHNGQGSFCVWFCVVVVVLVCCCWCSMALLLLIQYIVAYKQPFLGRGSWSCRDFKPWSWLVELAALSLPLWSSLCCKRITKQADNNLSI